MIFIKCIHCIATNIFHHVENFFLDVAKIFSSGQKIILIVIFFHSHDETFFRCIEIIFHCLQKIFSSCRINIFHRLDKIFFKMQTNIHQNENKKFCIAYKNIFHHVEKLFNFLAKYFPSNYF